MIRLLVITPPLLIMDKFPGYVMVLYWSILLLKGGGSFVIN